MKYSLLFYFLASIVCIKVQAYDNPNFILILTDDQGWTSLSSAIDPDFPKAKSDFHVTPNMDALLKMGVSFTNGYAAAPVCAPSRYSIQFGKSAARIKRTIARGPNYANHDQLGLAQYLKLINPDYLCAHLGKWHIDADPSRYGYDLHDGITKNKEGNFHNNNHKLQWNGYSEEDPKRVDSLTDRTINFISEALLQDRPFYVQLSHYAVHSDLVYSKESYEQMLMERTGEVHKNLSYAAMVMDLDKSIGKLLQAYEELGLSENTYIIFTSDNGGMPVLPIQVNKGRPYKQGLNSPLLRGKWDLMEGGIRVPFAIAGPNIPKKVISDTPVVGYDILPTIIELAQIHNNGVKIVLPDDIDGGSFARVALLDPSISVERSNEALIFHFPHYNSVGLEEPHSAIRIGNYKLVKFYSSDRSLLFDLSKDISESIDLSKKKKAKVKELEKRLSDYLISVDAELPEGSFTWKRPGDNGTVKTQFFKRYD